MWLKNIWLIALFVGVRFLDKHNWSHDTVIIEKETLS